MTLKKKIALVFFIPILFLLVFVSNFSGVCWTEFKKYSEEELIKKSTGDAYDENPYCCLVEGKSKKHNSFFSNLLGKYYFVIIKYVKRDEPITNDQNYPYNYGWYLVDQCGNNQEWSYSKTRKSEESYNWHVNRIKSKKEGNTNDR
ncbi:MAG: hypothetical protein PQ612_06880 [Rickettsiales bacterium]|nr:hypothetical protein [Pseudomonadota bacterium]MDA0966700.1 hypothetical protein [Pseudomonadota bacterium]MDG4543727.1 hypothetical protein [Rickettsiales bacterium]MDG4545874.1 hypothetical protein [Rickettsiales bacterium]MDG4547351.1 hypothetical protein [Rickettsiales bacterium]